MNKKKLILIGVSGIFVIAIFAIILSLILFKSDDNVVLSDNENNKNFINNSFLTLMLEQSDGTYQESKSNTWPSGNYAFNSELSRCENGGELRWNREEGIVELLSNKSDACYVYFDLYNVVTITNVQATKTTNSVTLTVTVDAGENPVAKYYFSMDGGRSYETSTSPNYTFSELTPNTSYTFQVYAVDSQGYESNEETIEVTTDNYVNPVVNSVTATSVSNDSITVSVSASAGTNNVATYYYSINDGSYASSSSNTYTFSGLNKGTTYSIKVYVKDTNGVDSGVYRISAETESAVLLADYIKGLYTSQGSNGLYYHTSSLANGAGDNSYRYAGANVNNYVCFGSDAATCPSDNLYRIIGVFGNEVKLIKNSSIGDYTWDSENSNIWDSSTKPDIRSTLNTTFLNTLSNTWQNKIVTHAWYVGGFSNFSPTPRSAFSSENDSRSNITTDSMKIGLMYVSDFGYATSPNVWTKRMNYYDGFSNRDNNWMFLSTEWTISRRSSGNELVFYIMYGTGITNGNSSGVNATRPCFYLTSSTQYISGSGTSTDPIRLS